MPNKAALPVATALAEIGIPFAFTQRPFDTLSLVDQLVNAIKGKARTGRPTD
jgi:hypothetical protein